MKAIEARNGSRQPPVEDVPSPEDGEGKEKGVGEKVADATTLAVASAAEALVSAAAAVIAPEQEAGQEAAMYRSERCRHWLWDRLGAA